jgi:hypothetical protein
LPKRHPTQVPVSVHSSSPVSGLPSSHGEQAGKRVCAHPTVGLHVSVVHELPSLQSPPVWKQMNAMQESVVHLLLSLQSALLRHCAEAARAAHSSSPPSSASRAARSIAAEESRGCSRYGSPPLAVLPIVVFIFSRGRTATRVVGVEQVEPRAGRGCVLNGSAKRVKHIDVARPFFIVTQRGVSPAVGRQGGRLRRRPVPVVPMALIGIWGSFSSRAGGAAMRQPFRRLWSKISW